MLKEFWAQILDLFFPPHCVHCNKIGTFLCEKCENSILRVNAQSCPSCNKLTETGRYCPNCRSKSSLSGVLVYGYFKDEKLKKVIHNYKYNKYSALAPRMAELLIKALQKETLNFDAVSYVPITKKRQFWRGFNQAELLAEHVALKLDKPIVNLIKARETNTQVGLKRRERQKNLEGAFIYKGEKLPSRILLIDDVVTTGTTLNECAKALKASGARTVYGLVIAKE